MKPNIVLNSYTSANLFEKNLKEQLKDLDLKVPMNFEISGNNCDVIFDNGARKLSLVFVENVPCIERSSLDLDNSGYKIEQTLGSVRGNRLIEIKTLQLFLNRCALDHEILNDSTLVHSKDYTTLFPDDAFKEDLDAFRETIFTRYLEISPKDLSEIIRTMGIIGMTLDNYVDELFELPLDRFSFDEAVIVPLLDFANQRLEELGFSGTPPLYFETLYKIGHESNLNEWLSKHPIKDIPENKILIEALSKTDCSYKIEQNHENTKFRKSKEIER